MHFDDDKEIVHAETVAVLCWQFMDCDEANEDLQQAHAGIWLIWNEVLKANWRISVVPHAGNMRHSC